MERMNSIEVAGANGRFTVSPKSAVEARAAQIVLMRNERDVTVRGKINGSSESVRPGAADLIQCRHRRIDEAGEEQAQSLARSAVESNVLEIELVDFTTAFIEGHKESEAEPPRAAAD